MPANPLLALNDDEFRKRVDVEVRGKATADEVAWHRDPALAERRLAALVYWKVRVEGQLGARREDERARHLQLREQRRTAPPETWEALDRLDDQAGLAHATWKAAVLRFKNSLEERINETTTMISSSREARSTREQALIAAIRDHQAAIEPEDATRADQTLWALVGASHEHAGVR